MKTLLAAIVVLFVAGCSTQSAETYYLASQQMATQASAAYQARMVALSEVAKSNPDQSGAVAMAIALSEPPEQQVAYVEDPALKWASVLAGPVAAVAGVYINSEQAIELAEINAGVESQRIGARSADQQAAYAAITAGQTAGVDLTNGLIGLTTTSLGVLENTVDNSFDFATASQAQSLGVVSDSLGMAENVVDMSLVAVGDTVNQSYQFAGQTVSDSYDFSTEALIQSYSFGGNLVDDAFDFTKYVVGEYDPYIIPPIEIVPVEITPVEITPVIIPDSEPTL